MGKDPAQTWAGDYLPLIFLKPWIRPAMRGARHGLLQIKFLDCGMNLLSGTGRHARG